MPMPGHRAWLSFDERAAPTEAVPTAVRLGLERHTSAVGSARALEMGTLADYGHRDGTGVLVRAFSPLRANPRSERTGDQYHQQDGYGLARLHE